MRAGKGRCDLMPLEVAAKITLCPIIKHVADFQKTNNTQHLYRALDRFAIECYSDESNENETCTELNAHMLLEVAKHYEDGAAKYGPDNWKMGIPTWCYIDSAVRHYLKWLRGDKDEAHNKAFVWNLMCCVWEVDYHNTDA